MLQVDLDEVRYQFMCRIAERIVQAGGTIFGGFLRDKLIRDHYSAEYERRKEKEGAVAALETLARTTIPENLDVVFDGDADQLQRFYERITHDDVDFTSGIDNRPHPFLRHGFRHSVNLAMKNAEEIVGKPINVYIDLFCSPVPIAFLASDQDLECNLLICDHEGIRMATDPEADESIFGKFARQQRLISQILARTTRVIPSHDGSLQNAVEMLLRGWTITNISSFHVVEPYHQTCLFCQDQIQGKAIHLTCCMKHAHPDCFSLFLQEPDRCFFSKTSCHHDTCFNLTTD